MGSVEIFNTYIPIQHGVLSGWKWTALIDTMVNIAELNIAKRCVERWTGEKVDIIYNAQGDDDDIRCQNLKHSIMLCHTYSYLGLKINPKKFFLRKNINEYLRKVQLNGIQLGYPARMVLTFNEVNPIREKQSSEMATIHADVKNWLDFMKRCDPLSSVNCMLGLKYSIPMIKQLMINLHDSAGTRGCANSILYGDDIIRRMLEVSSALYDIRDRENLAIIMPSGLGKTYLSVLFPDYLLDIDTLILPYKDIWLPMNNAGNWNLSNAYMRSILNRYGHLNKILLAHSPDQLPSSYRVIGILNSMTLNILNKSTVRGKFIYDIWKISSQNRQYLYDTYSNNELYTNVVSNAHTLRIIRGFIRDYSILRIDKSVKYTLVNNKIDLRMLRETEHILNFTKMKLSYDDIKYNVSWPVYRKLLVRMPGIMSNINIDDNGIDSYDQVIDAILHDQGDKLRSQVRFVLNSIFIDDLKDTRRRGRIERICDWLLTPAFLGGRGLCGVKLPITSGSKFKLIEHIIKPKTKYEPSRAVYRVKKRIKEIYNFNPKLETMYKSAEGTNKSFRDVGQIEFLHINDYNIRQNNWAFSVNYMVKPDDYIHMLTNKLSSYTRYNVPVISGIMASDYIYMEGIMEYISVLDIDSDEMSRVIVDNFDNSQFILEMRLTLSKNMWYKWLLGRLEINKPLRSDMNDTIISNYYSMNVDRLLSSGSENKPVGNENLKYMCYIIECHYLDMVSNGLKKMGIGLIS
jgi:hypothetical protein